MPKLTVLSRKEFERYKPKDGAVAISIYDASETRPVSTLYADVLPVSFYDVEEDIPGSSIKGISRRQAISILIFATFYWDVAPEIVIHCHAGESRSVAIASALMELFPSYIAEPLPSKGNISVYNKIIEAEQEMKIVLHNKGGRP